MVRRYKLYEEISTDKEKELVAHCAKEYNKFKKYIENYLDKMYKYINAIPDGLEAIDSLEDKYEDDININTTFKEFSDIVKYTMGCNHIYKCIKEAEAEFPLNMEQEINDLTAGKYSHYKSIQNAEQKKVDRKNKKS